MKASAFGMSAFTVFAYTLDKKGRVFEEIVWGEYNDLNEARRAIYPYRNVKELKFQIV
ncbi:hypothetical protein [Bacillus safensis]|uniref:hypothetical protein n=1 Tax=Bacillus safensis TaxID=561879 RepID=UPI001428BBFE|nr:hypothetical protein [Bacillus safensis]